jgi:hypothetical protein
MTIDTSHGFREALTFNLIHWCTEEIAAPKIDSMDQLYIDIGRRNNALMKHQFGQGSALHNLSLCLPILIKCGSLFVVMIVIIRRIVTIWAIVGVCRVF